MIGVSTQSWCRDRTGLVGCVMTCVRDRARSLWAVSRQVSYRACSARDSEYLATERAGERELSAHMAAHDSACIVCVATVRTTNL